MIRNKKRKKMWTRSNMLILIVLISFLFSTTAAQQVDYLTANASSVWTFGTTLRSSTSSDPYFACGFYCSDPFCDNFLFAVYVYISNRPTAPPPIVWSANRDRLVAKDATLRFSRDGNLVLRDADGTQVWSTNTTGKGTAGVKVTDTGNLVLFDKNNVVLWDSVDYPTDTWVLGQTLTEEHRLTANVPGMNWTQGIIALGIFFDGVRAFVDTNPPQVYYKIGLDDGNIKKGSTYVTFTNGSLSINAFTKTRLSIKRSVILPAASGLQYIKLESDGHLRLYQWINNGWKVMEDIMNLDYCSYPTVCGQYGVCSNGQCSCPSSGFKQVDSTQVNLGCELETALTCNTTQQDLVALANTSYFNYIDTSGVSISGTDEVSCKKACLSNCSCKAALFKYGANSSLGSCYLPSELFSMMKNDPHVTQYNSTAFIKVQSVIDNSSGTGKKVKEHFIIITTTSVGFVLLVIWSILIILRKIIKKEEVDEEDQLDLVSGIPTRFSYEELKIATENFCKKLGQGGFGSVFEGMLGDGTRVAVKQLEGVGQGKKEFLAEVETIGSIHHINLVRLIGFCAEKSHRLLIYEHMSNGSLDQWIFKRRDIVLDWDTRRRIITDIAKGLAYLHEDCRHRIAHLDIKPQNILLDQDLKAKVSDFGLSKLIDRNQSRVMTRMRGTPGYLAPEWLTSMITEKADVYSFGVVVIEILCGRKNLDDSKPEESFHLLSLVQKKFSENKVMDLVDDRIEDLTKYENEIIEMMNLAIWCLQNDSTRRPPMSMVVKVLEGLTSVESDIEYKFLIPISRTTNDQCSSAPPSASFLSEAR